MKQRVSIQHLYIHWPFCKNKCHYCDFVALQGHNVYQEQYHQALCAEITAYSNNLLNRDELCCSSRRNSSNEQPIKTIFIGGGTPSLYPLPLLKKLFTQLHNTFDLSDLQEVTLEVNPGNIDRTKLATWANLGFTRISIGVQVLDEAVLYNLNRHQKISDVLSLIELAPDYFEAISVDLILGLPGVTDVIWKKTLETVVLWPITHISIYFLTVHENTPLFHKVKKGLINIVRDDHMVKLYEDSVDFLAMHQFMQYEISNFAKSGYQSLHNQAYWDRKAYKGFGIGAASFDGRVRERNEKNLSRYIQYWTCDKKKNDTNLRSAPFTEIVTSQQEQLEVLMLSLRQKKGLDLHRMLYYWDVEKLRQVERTIVMLKNAGLVQEYTGTVQLTPKGMALEHEVVLKLLL